MRIIAVQPNPVRAITLSVLAALLVSLVALVAPVSADPPGNNGTVKIDGVPFDDHPDNEPHPGCVFQVDFYGYDEGLDLFASVTFEHWNPTGDGHGDVLLHEEGIFIGEDDNGGGGSEDGLDASRTYDLSAALAGMEPHPQQGFHIKLTVHADGSQGADTKHKVFWVECEGEGSGEQGQVVLEKVDQDGAGRAGAVFTLTGVTDPSFSATATTSATGSAGFTALVAGQYTLVETTPPSGCTGFSGSVTITVDAEGEISVGTLPAGVSFVNGTIRVVNDCGGGNGGEEGQVPLVKVDQNGAGRAGAVFTLTGVTDPSFSATATTSASGAAMFGSLVAGQYTLVETTPPSGCTGFSGSVTITVDAEGEISVGTLPAGVSFSAGTLTVVNTCGGGSQANTTAAAASVTPPSCTAVGTLVVPANTASVTYSVSPAYTAGATGTFTVTATANAGFVLVGQSQWTLTVAPMLTGAVCVSGGGTLPGNPTTPVRGGTLGSSSLPNTVTDAPTSEPLPTVLIALVALGSLAYVSSRNLRAVRLRR